MYGISLVLITPLMRKSMEAIHVRQMTSTCSDQHVGRSKKATSSLAMEKGKAILVNVNDEDYNNLDNGGVLNFKKRPVFVDRSKVRILLWDRDTKSSEEVSTLLCSCDYKVNSVRSATEVIDFLKAEGPRIDILLVEVHLPMEKSMKALTHIMRDQDLRHIPVIMLSTRAEISTVVNCLRLGAADYLMKPLRTNELLQLWTHMWRKRRMLGLPEKNIMVPNPSLASSNPSAMNMNNGTLLPDDCPSRAIPEMSNMRLM